jgi:CheY-like chemotaxis protein
MAHEVFAGTEDGTSASGPALEALGRVAVRVAHDLNNFLTIINGYSNLLQGRLADGDPAQDMIREIGRASDEAAELTRQLVALSRQQAPPEDESAPALRAEPMAAISGTILLAEDEEALRRLLIQILQLAGYQVLAARDGVDALEISQNHAGPIDLLVTDMVMPNMGGRELYQNLTALRPEIKAVFMSGYTDDQVLRREVCDAAIPFLQKPFVPAVFTSKIKEVLQSRKARREI